MNRWLAAAFLLSGLFVLEPALAAPTSALWCTFVDNPGAHATHYVNDNVIPADPAHRAEITYAWSQYIRATYAPNSSTPIGPCDTVAGDPARSMTQMEQQWKAAGHTIIHVHWTYTPQAAEAAPATPAAGGTSTTPGHRITEIPWAPEPASAPAASPAAPVAAVTHAPPPAVPAQPPASAAAAAAAPAGKAYRCIFTFHEGKQAMRYSGGPFITDAAAPALKAEWEKYIDAAYHPADPHRRGGCTQLSGKPANWGKAVSSYEQNSNQLGVHTTHVEWSSAPKL